MDIGRRICQMLVLGPVALGPAAMASAPSPLASPPPGVVGKSLGDVIVSDKGAKAHETDAGQAALHSASAMKKQAHSLVGEEREAGLLRAAAAYGAVADAEKFGVLDRVEGAFRAGEILRARGLVEEAQGKFSQAVALGEPVDEPHVRMFAARALLEEAHQRRREGEVEDALESYAAVRSRFGDCDRPGTHAVSWTGKLLLKEGRLDEARLTLLDFEPFLPDYPLDAVRNVDALVDALVAQGEADKAYEAVASLEDAVSGGGETMTQAVKASLDALRDKVGQSGY
jgi:tetratricopeptide (TPR) repeat protein